MLVHENTIISDDVLEKYFVCNLKSCKGACCVEGDAGAPLTKDELLILEDNYEKIKPYLTSKSIEVIEKDGMYEVDAEGEFGITTIEGKECVFAIYDENKILKCGIEQAYNDNKITFKKPISCHLYPIRITKSLSYDLINYERWDICSDACSFGANLKVPLYMFLKEPLVRKYGLTWYNELEMIIKQKNKDI